MDRRQNRERVAIGGRACRRFGAQIARSPGAVLDDDRLPEQFGGARGKGASDDIGAGARRERYNEAQRFGRIALCVRVGGERERAEYAKRAHHA